MNDNDETEVIRMALEAMSVTSEVMDDMYQQNKAMKTPSSDEVDMLIRLDRVMELLDLIVHAHAPEKVEEFSNGAK